MKGLTKITTVAFIVALAMSSCSKLETLEEASGSESELVEMRISTSNESEDESSGITDPDHDEDHDKDDIEAQKN